VEWFVKEIIWMGNSLEILREFSDEVKDEIGFSLHLLQEGQTPDNAKPLKGDNFRGIFEIRANYDSDTYRVIYTVKIDERLYVLHSFKKKSTKGANTPKKELEVIKIRFNRAKELSLETQV
jgi:phage-related protein